MAGFELATEDEGREGELLFWQTELGAKLKKVRPEYYENDDEEKQELSGPNAFRPVFEWSLRRGLGISFAGVEGPRRRWALLSARAYMGSWKVRRLKIVLR
jgi:hypothetical protein